ncbi:MAG: aminotransferase class V-fold PLP-dependent enzyme [bacterium]|nr:aminotransferase class V-fold PLP-dependent enzyme [Candidatus Kapabacteria bacterium]
MPMDLRTLFMLRPEVAFLNHGSFGACPRPVMAQYQSWQLESETEPVEFHARRAAGLLQTAREALGELVGADANDLVYVTNATVAVNIVARSLRLGPTDEVLGTDHEYGACERVWRFLSTRGGPRYRSAHIPVPVTTHEDMIEQLFSQIGPDTRVIFISHITSPTALTFPIAEVCRRARELGLMTIVDGAHVPGQMSLNLREIDPDFYTGNLHKWLCAPKGAAFLYARNELQPMLDPLVVSWGYESIFDGPSQFIDAHEYRGTRDISPALTVPFAIDFQREHNWKDVIAECHAMVKRARPLIAEALDAVPIAPEGPASSNGDATEWYVQMSAFLLPDGYDRLSLGTRLFDEHQVEIPTFGWNDRQTIRISIQGYNTWNDVERLLDGIRAIRNR